MPAIVPGDDLARHIARADLRDGDVVVVAQKVVSKAEGRIIDLATVVPTARAAALGTEIGKDPRIVEAILSEAVRVVRSRPGLLIVEHRLGFVMANAGVDQSNVARADGRELVLLLPDDPDVSAARLRDGLRELTGKTVGVIVSDSFGRAWRRGTVGIAIGVAGLPALRDMRGKPDLFGRILEVSIIGYADEIAAAASLIMGQAGEGRPVVVVRGLQFEGEGTGQDLVRPAAEDLFR